jgi:predicted metal-dependent RNase
MRIENINGLSAHAGMNDLQRWLDNFKAPPKHVFLTHGEEGSIFHISSQANTFLMPVNTVESIAWSTEPKLASKDS